MKKLTSFLFILLCSAQSIAQQISPDIKDNIQFVINDIKSQFESSQIYSFSNFIVIKKKKHINICGQINFVNNSISIFYYDGSKTDLLINNNGESELIIFEESYNKSCKKTVNDDEILTYSNVYLQ